MNKERLHSLGLLFLRVLTGAGILHHGYGKLFTGHMGGFAEGVAHLGLPFPTVFAWAAALSEFLGGLLLVLGLKTRIAALFIFITMSVAVFLHHAHDPINVKELALAYWTISGALVFLGAGRYALDRS